MRTAVELDAPVAAQTLSQAVERAGYAVPRDEALLRAVVGNLLDNAWKQWCPNETVGELISNRRRIGALINTHHHLDHTGGNHFFRRATIIASQAVISGAFSLTQMAVQLGFMPRVSIKHTSATMERPTKVGRLRLGRTRS